MNRDDILRHAKNGRLAIIAQPNAKKTEILSWDAGRGALRVALAAPPEKGKANLELVKFLKRATGRPVVLVSGLSSREKVVMVR